MTMFRRGCVVLMVIWTSACGGRNTTITSPSASSTTPGGPALTTFHATIAHAINVKDGTGATIVFHVQDGTGAPIVGALLQATSPTVGPWQGATDGAGNFMAGLAPAHYDLMISAAGFGTRALAADLASAGTVTIGLARGGPIPPGPIPPGPIPPGPIPPGQLLLTGRVTDGTSGGILPNITLTLSGDASATAITDGNGNYQFGPMAAGSYTVSASPISYIPNSQSISLAAGNTVLNLVLQRGIASLSAVFTVTSNSTPPLKTANSCQVSPATPTSAGLKVDCTFDGSGSTPAALLTTYQYSIVETNEKLGSVVTLTNPPLPSCNVFNGSTNGAVQATVRLTVTSNDGRSASVPKTVTFSKNGVC